MLCLATSDGAVVPGSGQEVREPIYEPRTEAKKS
jgi:hypothetical protein